MNFKKPLILISNDDGYRSNGIRTLVSFLTDFADVVVCAPESGRSGFSCAFSVVDYLLLKDNITFQTVRYGHALVHLLIV